MNYRDDLIAEWVDDYPEIPKAWKDLTPEEKGALLLAHREGTTLQYYNEVYDFWSDTETTFHPMDILRIKPKPARKTVTLYGAGWHYEQAEIPCDDDTHRITFDLVDGEPDTDSIKMEKL